MRSLSGGDSDGVLPWLLIRQDGNGNRYRVGSYGTRSEAQHLAERLGKECESAGSDGYVVEHIDVRR
ncbi:SPOR domain-containing protein [Streptomyces boncukensis]|uniref:SPOR domain-containing protein n=1 Tax=Streptomyces boncukensis TaxID=2711219 RepID=A0A6G4WZM5_9ACTN|nr:SPOR domain-containing protein [Streptomyces boncukensis]NGO70322.1 SPOR domain-containing protein [Streptomyces boncukensis]